ncbi:MAG: hypothetical protein ACLPSF_11130 [Methylocella sp.]
MKSLSKWLQDRPYRLTVLNALLLTLVLGVIGSAPLFKIVGGAAVAIAGLAFLGKAVAGALRGRGRGHLYELVLLWAPGLIAITLSLAAIGLIAANPSGGLAYGLGVVLFGAELAILIIGGSDAAAFPASLSEPA